MNAPSEYLSRIPPLVGALNFRDMGGYRTVAGGCTGWNRLYRSGTTHSLTQSDLAWLTERQVRFGYDLRSDSERLHKPNRLQDIADLRYRFSQHDEIVGDLGRALRDASTGRECARQTMLEFYRALPYTFKHSYRALFLHLAHGDLPLVFNCTAGKDRTGVAAALILSVLEVPWASILEDYLLTEQFFQQTRDMIVDNYVGAIADITSDVLEPLLRVDADYLEATFERLQVEHGSVINYVHSELGLSPAEISRMRANLID